MSWPLLTFFLGLADATSPSPAPPQAALEEARVVSTEAPKVGATPERRLRDEGAVVEFELANGLKVVLSEAHDRGQVFGSLVVRSGSRDDPADDTGMAHYLEHMLFKGTTLVGTTDPAREEPLLQSIEMLFERLRSEPPSKHAAIREEIAKTAKEAAKYAIPNEVDRLLAEMGGLEVNAFTHPDMTVYHNAFPGSQVASWLELTAERFADPVFRLFPSELETVYEEKNRAMDGFLMPAYEAFTKAFFPHHTYGTQTTLGTAEDLKQPSIRAMKEFFAKHYVASNMVLVLVGDFDAAAIRPLIERTFARIPSGAAPKRAHGMVRPFRGREQDVVRVTPLRAGAIAFRTPVMGHADYAATKVTLALISNPQRTGLLDRRVDAGKLLMAIHFELDFHEYNGSILAYAPRILTQSFAAAERTIVGALGELARQPVGPEVVAASRDYILKDIELQWEDHERRALLLGDLAARGLTWADYKAYLAAVAAVSGEQVQAIARRYFGDDRLEVRSRMGKGERTYLQAPGETAVKPRGGRQSAYYRDYAGATHPAPEPQVVDLSSDVTEHTVRPGLVLHRNVNPFNDIESAELRFGLGHHDRPELELLAAYLERAGSLATPGESFADRLFALSAKLEVSSTPEAFVFRVEAPAPHFRAALDLVGELSEGLPRDRRQLRRLRLEHWATERALRAQPDVLADALWESVVYGYHSRYRRRGARAQRGWSLRDLEAAWAEVRRHALEVRYTGQRPLSAVGETLTAALALPEDVKPAVRPRIRPSLRPAANRVVFLPRPGAVQTQIRIYVPGRATMTSEAPREHAFHEYFGGGMAGLVFQEVREYRALAYVAQGGFQTPRHAHYPGYTYINLACQADKTQDALEVAMDLLGDLESKPERIEGLRRALIHRQETSDPFFRELQAQIERWTWHGSIDDPRPDWIDAYAGISMTDIEAFWRRQVHERPVVIMVVGDPQSVRREMLESHGAVETTRVGALYRP